MYNATVSNYFRLAAVTFTLLTLSACGTRTISDVDVHGTTKAPIFPAVNDASRTDGTYVNLENLHKIAGGMTKAQVRELIGAPHFSEGMFDVHEWDYILKFRQPAGQPDEVCQYKVLFDNNMVAQSFFFLPENCMQPTSQEKSAKSEKQISIKSEDVTLAADSTFAFGSAQLSTKGKSTLTKLFNDLKLSSVSSVDIVGYTDRIGNQQRNEELSLNRAGSVRSYLIEQGTPSQLISIDGRGAADPIVACPGAESPEAINCLAPNRRTTVTIISK